MPYEVQCVFGPAAGRSYPFNGRSLTFGRGGENDVVLEGPLVSRHHAELIWAAGSLTLRDLDSANGTWVAGNRIVERAMGPGEAFQLGSYRFLIRGEGPDVAEAPTAPSLSAQFPIPDPGSQPQQYIPPTLLTVEEARRLRIEDYDLLDMVGVGAAAAVFRGKHRETGEIAAIKVLRNSAEDYFKQKFVNEAALALQLKHPNIVEAFAAAAEEDSSYIIMEYMKDGSLRALMGRYGGMLPVERAVDLARQICGALDFAHGLGIYHRDLKPENILLDGDTAKLGDFGIARLTGMKTITRDGMIVGTPAYMSYEQAKGLPVNARSDQYSLGIVLYEMLTGRTPFVDRSPLNVVTMHLSEQPAPPRSLNPAIPTRVEEAILRALDKDHRKRYETMADMAAALGVPAESPAGPSTLPSATAGNDPVPPPYVPPAAGPRLVGVAPGQVIRIETGETVIGRAMLGGNSAVSKQHARLRRSGSVVTLEDLGSTNGTWVNNQRISSAVVLSPGAQLRFGPVAYEFESE